MVMIRVNFNMPNKQKDLIDFAEKGGQDSGLFLLDKIHAIQEELENLISELKEKFDTAIQEIKENTPDLNRVLESVKGKDSDIPGPKPVAGIDYPIPENGKDYILTEKDKKEIADKIDVPIIEKIIEKTEVIKEQPIITNEIKEIAKYDKPEEIRNKLETLKGGERISISAIDGLEEKIKEIPERPTTTVFGGKMTRVATFSFTGDGVLTAFTLPREPAGKGLAIWAYYQGQWLQPKIHFNIVKLTFTTTFVAENNTIIEGFLLL